MVSWLFVIPEVTVDYKQLIFLDRHSECVLCDKTCNDE